MSGAIDKLFLLCVLSLLSACSPGLRSRTETALDDVESYINERPDSALAVLRALDSAVIVRGPALRARAALLHSMALDKCYIDLQTDSILAPAVAWYSRHGTPDEKLKTWYYLGRTQYNAGDYRAAIVTYTEALDFTEKAADYKYMGLVNQAMADTYGATYLEKESYPYLKRAYRAFLAIPDTTLAKLTLYKQSLFDVEQRNWERADSIHQVLLKNPQGIEPYLSRIKANDAVSLLFRTNDNIAKARTQFEEILNKDGRLPFTNHWAAYAYCLSASGRREQADSIFDYLNASYPSDKRISFWRNKAELKNGEYKAAYLYLQEALEYQDSVLRHTLNQSTIAAQKDFFAYRAAQETDRARHRKRLLLLSLVLSFMALTIVALLVHQHVQKEKHEKTRLLLLIDTIQRQSEEAAQDRNQQYTHLFQNYFNTLGRICADYEEGRIRAVNAADKVVIRRIDRIVHDFVGNAESHQEFEDMLDRYMDHIMTSFRKDFPKLKLQDYQLASYVFSGIDMSTTSVLMGIDVDVLYTRKSRLKSTIMKSSASGKTRYLSYFR